MPKPPVWPLYVLIASVAFCRPAFAIFSDDQARQGVAELRQQVQTLGERVDNLARAQVTQSNDLERLREEMRRLTGRIEELQYKLEQIEKRQRDFYLDLDARLTALGAGATGSAAGDSPR